MIDELLCKGYDFAQIRLKGIKITAFLGFLPNGLRMGGEYGILLVAFGRNALAALILLAAILDDFILDVA
ncbi:hypothetical protein D3C73_1274740 [compost metagenome]